MKKQISFNSYNLFLITCLSLLLCLSNNNAFANTDKKDQPIEISADKTLEWDRNNNRYIASGNVEVKQGDLSLFTDSLSAHYNPETGTGMQNIEKLKLKGNIKITSAEYTAHGDNGEYDISSGIATLTGDNLKIITPDETITARDSLEYDSNKMEFMAVGNTHVRRGLNNMNADMLIAEFKKEANNPKDGQKDSKIRLKNVIASGNVMISTQTEKIYGNKAVYNLQTEIATITGNVKIEQGKNNLLGTKVTVNLKTGISHIHAENSKDGKKGRVTGIFFPK